MHRSEPPALWHLEVGPLGGDRGGVAPGWDGRTCEDGVTALCPVGRASSRGIKPPSAPWPHTSPPPGLWGRGGRPHAPPDTHPHPRPPPLPDMPPFLCSPHQPSFQARAETPRLLRSPARSGLFKCYAEHLYNRELRQREHGDADVYVLYRERYSWDSQHTKQVPKPGVLQDPLMGDDRRERPTGPKKENGKETPRQAAPGRRYARRRQQRARAGSQGRAGPGGPRRQRQTRAEGCAE